MQYIEKDPIDLELQKLLQLNTQTKEFIEATSPNSLTLFFALASLNAKQLLYYDVIKENDRIDEIKKEDIMDSICELHEYDDNYNFMSKKKFSYFSYYK